MISYNPSSLSSWQPNAQAAFAAYPQGTAAAAAPAAGMGMAAGFGNGAAGLISGLSDAAQQYVAAGVTKPMQSFTPSTITFQTPALSPRKLALV